MPFKEIDPHRQAELLEVYCESVLREPEAPLPAGLDADRAATVRRLARDLAQVKPAPEFSAALHRRLAAQAEALARGRGGESPDTATARQWWRPRRAWSFVGLAAILLAIVATGAYMLLGRAQAVNAQEVIQKAQAAATSPAVGGVQSFVLTQVWHSSPANGQGEEMVSENKRWYQAPGRWRSEYRQWTVQPDGTRVVRFASLQISDGTDVWLVDPDSNRVTVNRFSPEQNGKRDLAPFGQGVDDLSTLLQQASTCYDPKVAGTETIAGRPAYVLDLGPTKCPSASVPEGNGRLVIWVDKETFFVLKQEQYSLEGQTPIMRGEVTSVQYNIVLDPALFTFTPPEGASVLDGRPQALPTLPPSIPTATPAAPSATPPPQASPMPSATPAPTTNPQQAALLAALAPLAREADYPLFVPDGIPSGLEARLPKLQPDEVAGRQLWIEYVPVGQAEQDTFPQVRIIEQRASYQVVVNWTGGAIPVQVPAGKGWVRPGAQMVKGASDSAALILRDGTLISISSFALTPEELLKLARSLQAVPGSHAPLPEPTPPTLAEVRANAPYPIWIPTWVPEGLTPDPPVGYVISYYDADGQRGLEVSNGTGLADDPRRTGEPITLPNGLTAHLLDMPANYGGPILWWVQEGTPIAISGPKLTRDDLIKIADSMSKTADLGPTRSSPGPTPAPVLPPPTATPTPAFAVLRPSWLPERMSVREQVDGETVILGFDPRPDDAIPHDVMTLMEMPKRLIDSGGTNDPQATVEKIGAYEVTVVHRGSDCTAFDWDAGELHLSLTNAYDPPGHIRYTCEQLRKVIESIQSPSGSPASSAAPTPAQEGFAIYLPVRQISAGDILSTELADLELEDKPVLSASDIITYARDTHEFTLTPAASQRVKQMKVPVAGIPFVVCVDRQPIYAGAFWASYSSLSYEGTVIDVLSLELYHNLQIQIGYPVSPEYFQGEDRRADPRILRSLEQAGKLR